MLKPDKSMVVWHCPGDLIVHMRTSMATSPEWCSVRPPCFQPYQSGTVIKFDNRDLKNYYPIKHLV